MLLCRENAVADVERLEPSLLDMPTLSIVCALDKLRSFLTSLEVVIDVFVESVVVEFGSGSGGGNVVEVTTYGAHDLFLSIARSNSIS